jgi:3-oxoacyl-[acyl-carrier protein] reductase
MFCQAGAQVFFNYRNAESQATQLIADCGGDANCRTIRQELATPFDGASLVRAAVESYGRLDCLVVNHGVWPPHDIPIESMSEAQWRSTLGVNLDSTFGLVRAAVSQMKQQQPFDTVRGHIVLVASTAAQRGEAFHADYAASKGALISLTKSISSELAAEGIYCNCVAPGWVDTEMSSAALTHPETSKKVLASIPLGRPARVEEIAGPILFLCTPLAGFISGEIFNVNGGAVLVG